MEGDTKYAKGLTSVTLDLIVITFKLKSMTDLISYQKKIWREEVAEKIQLPENKVLCNLKKIIKMKVGKAPGPDTVLPSVSNHLCKIFL